MGLREVDYDPFEEQPGGRLVEVDYDPFDPEAARGARARSRLDALDIPGPAPQAPISPIREPQGLSDLADEGAAFGVFPQIERRSPAPAAEPAAAPRRDPMAFDPRHDAADALGLADAARVAQERGLPAPTRPGPTIEAADRLLADRARENARRQQELVAGVNERTDRAIEREGMPGRAESQLASGVGQVHQAAAGHVGRYHAGLLPVMDRIDAGQAVPDIDDPLGYQHMNPVQRKQARELVFKAIGESARQVGLATRTMSQIPREPDAEKMTAEIEGGDWGAAWRTFINNPIGITQQFSLESLPLSLPGMAAGIGGAALGRLPGFMIGLAAGNYPIEYVAAFGEAMEEFGVDLSNPAQVEEALKHPTVIKRIGDLGHRRGMTIAAVEAATGALYRPLALGKGLARNVGRAATNIGIGAVEEPLGEGLAQVAAGQEFKPSEVVAEFLGAGPQAVGTTVGRTIAEARGLRSPEQILSDALNAARGVAGGAEATDPAAAERAREAALEKWRTEGFIRQKEAMGEPVPNPEQRAGPPVAESQAPDTAQALETGYAGVAPGREIGAPEKAEADTPKATPTEPGLSDLMPREIDEGRALDRMAEQARTDEFAAKAATESREAQARAAADEQEKGARVLGYAKDAKAAMRQAAQLTRDTGRKHSADKLGDKWAILEDEPEAGKNKARETLWAAQGEPEVGQSVRDRVLADAELFGDGSDAQALQTKGFESISRDRQRMVLSHVRAALDDEKILRAVVESVPVDVMYGLVGRERSTENLLHDKSVLAHRLSVPSDVPVPKPVIRFVDSLASAIGRVATGDRAEKADLPSMRPPAEERNPAMGASAGGGLDAGATAKMSAERASDLGGWTRKDGSASGADEGGGGHVVVSIAGQADTVNVTPTEAQKEAGSYKKGHFAIAGMDVSIENPAGSTRSGTDANGKRWESKMNTHYGYIRGTVGFDKDHLDVVVKPGTSQGFEGTVFVVNQNKANGHFDEQKVIIGASSLREAKALYLSNYERGWDSRIRSIVPVQMDAFKAWAYDKTKAGPRGGELKAKEVRDERAVAIPESSDTSRDTGAGAPDGGRNSQAAGVAPGTEEAARPAEAPQGGRGGVEGKQSFRDFEAPKGDKARGIIKGQVRTFTTQKQAEMFARQKLNAVPRGFAPRETPDGWVLSKPVRERTEAQKANDAALRAASKVTKADDNLGTVLAKAGGIRIEALVEEGADPKDITAWNRAHRNRAARRGRGLSMDGAAEVLAEQGFDVLDEEGRFDANKAWELIHTELLGERVYSPEGSVIRAEKDAEARAKLEGATRKTDRALAGYDGLSQEEQAALAEFFLSHEEWAASYPDAEITAEDTTNEEIAARQPGQDEAEDADASGGEPSPVAPQAGVQAEGAQGGEETRPAAGRAQEADLEKSAGHIAWFAPAEGSSFPRELLTKGGDLYIAPADDVLDVHTRNRAGRFYGPDREDFRARAIKDYPPLRGEAIEPRPALELTGETEGEIRAREALEQREREAKAKRDAAPEPGGFVLTGSNRAADEARARGQMELAPAASKPEAPEDEAASVEVAPPSLNKRHAIAKDSVLTPAGAIKTGAIRSDADSAAWHYQGDLNALAFNSVVVVNGKTDEAARERYAKFKAAQGKGWKPSNYRAGSYGTLWVLERDGTFLTNAGFDNIEASAVERPVLPSPTAGFESMATRQLLFAKHFVAWLNTLPEGSADNRGVVSRKIGETPVKEWARINEDGNGGVSLDYYEERDALTPSLRIGAPIITKGEPGTWEGLLRLLRGLASRADAALAGPQDELYAAIYGAERDAKVKPEPGQPIPQARTSVIVEEFETDVGHKLTVMHNTEKKQWGLINFTREGTTVGQWFAGEDAEAKARELYAKWVESAKEYAEANKKAKAAREAEREAAKGFVEKHDALIARLRSGDLGIEEYRDGFKRVRENGQAIYSELGKLTKEQLARRSGYRTSDKKAQLIRGAYDAMISAFARGEAISYSMLGGSVQAAVQKIVDGTTVDDLASFARKVAEAKAERERRLAEFKAAVDNPQTLDDFRNFIRARGEAAMTPEQRRAYEDLQAGKRLEERAEAAEKKGQVQDIGQTVGAQVIKTKHTKKGHDLFVVQLAERVERDIYNRLNSEAKRLGGYYSSFRGGGAVPGFQFTTMEAAEAFKALASEGDTEAATQAASARRAERDEEVGGNAVERLRSMAERLEDAGSEEMNRDRLANTARRARMADAAERAAQGQIQLARTMRRIADAIESGEAKFLAGIRTKQQIIMLTQAVAQAHADRARELTKEKPYSDFERESAAAVTEETADHIKWPRYTMRASDIESLAAKMRDVPGMMQLAERMRKGAARQREELYAAAVLSDAALRAKVLLSLKGGQPAILHNKTVAERAASRSSLGAIVVSQARTHYIVLSPERAIEAKAWADPDPMLALSDDIGRELAEKLDRYNAGKASVRQITAGWWIGEVAQRQRRLRAMGVEDDATYRAAAREFIRHRAEQPAANKVRELERALAGRKDIGIDFFPTPAALAERMAEALDVQPGMRVLEPSAGKGNLADAVREAQPEADIEVVEQSSTLREILKAKGYDLAGQDFNEFEPDGQYDRVIMNPPFSNGIDADHVRRAYEMLKPGGRLVAITGEGIFFRQDAKASAFREWFEQVGGESERLEGAFTDRREVATTGVVSRMIVIDKPGDVPTFSRLSSKDGPVSGLPYYWNEKVGLTAPRAHETQPIERDGRRRIAYDIIEMPVYSRELAALVAEGVPLSLAKRRAEARAAVGMVLVNVRRGEFTDLYNIEINADRRGRGLGEAVVSSMLDSQDGKIHIHQIEPDAVDFWVKMGAKFPRSLDYMEARLDRFQYAKYQRDNGRQARPEAARGDDAEGARGARSRAAGGRQGAQASAGAEPDSLDFTKSGFRRGSAGRGLALDQARAALVAALGEKAVSALESSRLLTITASEWEWPKQFHPFMRGGERGVYHKGRAYVAAGSHRDADALVQTVLHEIGEHHGLEAMLGAEKYAQLARRIKTLNKAGNPAVKAAWAKVERQESYKPGSEPFMAEVIARVGQDQRVQRMTWWRELLDAIRAFVIKHYSIPSGKLTDEHVKVLLRASLAKSARQAIASERRRAGTARAVAMAIDGEVPQFHVAYHGGREDFDAFSTEFIGTGEGAQAYGWGLYFAGKREVAEFYRRAATRNQNVPVSFLPAIPGGWLHSTDSHGYQTWTNGSMWIGNNGRSNIWYVNVDKYGSPGRHPRDLWVVSRQFSSLEEAQRFAESWMPEIHQGRLYEVDLAPKEEDYLDWDKPFVDQSEKVREILSKMLLPDPALRWVDGDFGGFLLMDGDTEVAVVQPQEGGDGWEVLFATEHDGFFERVATAKTEGAARALALRMVRERAGGPDQTGREIYLDIEARLRGAKEASLYLKSLGIPGIRYLDGSSRSRGEGHHNYVIFDEADVKITAKFARGEPAPLWFSALERVVEGAKQQVAPAAQWKAWIKNQPGVKADEIEWSGVNEWLDTQGPKVTKAELLDFLKANGVRVEEKELGEAGGTLPRNGRYGPMHIESEQDQFTPNGVVWVVYDGDTALEEVYASEEEAREAEIDYLENELENGAIELDGATKFSSYQLPGGSNYRELLLTLPEKNDIVPTVKYRVFNAEGNEEASNIVGRERAERILERDAPGGRIEEYGSGLKDLSVNFRSSHFDEPNILAHVRFNERADAEGKRILFIEEIQSDFGQKTKRARDDINKAVDEEFEIIVKRMEDAGVLKVECD